MHPLASYSIAEDEELPPQGHSTFSEQFSRFACSLVERFQTDSDIIQLQLQERKLEELWSSGNRVASFRIAFDVASKLGQQPNSENYPARVARTNQVLGRFASLLRTYIKSSANIPKADDLVMKWSSNIGLVRNVIARTYLILATVSVLEYRIPMEKLMWMSRAISDPIISAYIRMSTVQYVAVESVIDGLQDQIHVMYPRCDAGVLPRIESAITFMLNCIQHYRPSPLHLFLASYQEFSADARLLSIILNHSPPDVIVANAKDVVAVIVNSHPINADNMGSLLKAVSKSKLSVSQAIFTSLRRVTLRINSDDTIIQLAVYLTKLVLNHVVPWSGALFRQLYDDLCQVAGRSKQLVPLNSILDVILCSAHACDALKETVRDP